MNKYVKYFLKGLMSIAKGACLLAFVFFTYKIFSSVCGANGWEAVAFFALGCVSFATTIGAIFIEGYDIATKEDSECE